MSKAARIFAVGETILDIVFKEDQVRAAKAGGSSFNASITLGRLGAPITFISEMGKDRVGDLIARFMAKNGVDDSYVNRYKSGKSALALAFLNERNDAEYQFYKDYPGQRLAVDFPDFQRNDLLVFGSFYALNPGIRPRVKALLEKAQAAGALILYDPNFRDSHLAEREQLIPVIKENMAYAQVVRASDEDLHNIFQVESPGKAWELVEDRCQVLIYTANARGIWFYSKAMHFHMKVEQIQPLSTIGAGDTFNAGLLYGMWQEGLERHSLSGVGEPTWRRILAQAALFSKEVCLSYDNYLPWELAKKIKS